ncbi:MAG: hypothetical protein ACLUHA_13815 [Bacteroides stercoris]
MYGSRGSNGVVLITTKRGQEGRATSVPYNGYYGWQTVSKEDRHAECLRVCRFGERCTQQYVYRQDGVHQPQAHSAE